MSLRTAGAEVVDPADLPSMIATDAAKNLTSHNTCQVATDGTAPDDLCSNVLRYGIKRDFQLLADHAWCFSPGEDAQRVPPMERRASEPGGHSLVARHR